MSVEFIEIKGMGKGRENGRETKMQRGRERDRERAASLENVRKCAFGSLGWAVLQALTLDSTRVSIGISCRNLRFNKS